MEPRRPGWQLVCGKSGSLSPVDLTDNIGIGTAAPNEQLEITGNFRLPVNTARTGLIMSDGNRFIHNFGTNNFFAGANAGNLNMTGICCNTGVGVDALMKNTTGLSNTAAGFSAFLASTAGSNNTAVGFGADVSSSNMTNATAIGNGALVNASNKIRLGNSSVTVLETAADVFVETRGLGIILRDTDGAGCHRITVNSAAILSAAVVTCQ